jgi:large subunit ribosomal protein L10
MKTFADEFQKPQLKAGVLDGKLLDADAIKVLASLPTKDVLRSQLLGVFKAPMGKLVRLLNEPAASLARVLQAKADKQG